MGEAMAQRKKSDREVMQELERRLQEIEFLRQQAQQQGISFSAPSKAQLEKKIRGETSNSPYFTGHGWVSGTTLGSPASVHFSVANSDPIGYHNVFVSVFFGVGNFVDHVADAIAGRETRWPYMSTPPFSLAPGASSLQFFNYNTPSIVERSTYIGNALLWAGELHDKGTYFDRAMFYVTLT
jgi:hypothetical protein